MELRIISRTKLVTYFYFTCCSVVVIFVGLMFISIESIRRDKYIPVDEALRQPSHVHQCESNVNRPTDIPANTSAAVTSKPQPPSSQRAPTMYSILVVSIDDWRDKMVTFPRTVRCEDSQSSARVEKLNTSNLNHLKQADYLIFTGFERNDEVWRQLQRNRNERQLWVFSSAESAYSHRHTIPPRGMNYIHFNITSTFHPNSHIPVPYGKFVRWDLNAMKEYMTVFVSNLYDQKKKLAVWVSSHCPTSMWKRFEFVHDLAKLIPVDTYGKCGELSCSLREYCKDKFGKYKFFIAFENSCCGGYITEKFWNALGKFHAIPVVIGAKKSDYLQQAPPKSFIHADDFDSMQDLAKYILKVAKNKKLYDDYIKWKINGRALPNSMRNIYADSDAGVCRLLNYTKSNPGKIMTFDPYGPNWLGGCFQCGEHSWIKNYSNWEK